MKKSLLAGILILAIIFVLPVTLNAQEVNDFDLSDLSAVAGISYTTFNEADDGPGIYLGAGLEATPELFAVAQYERYFTSNLSLNGIAGTFSYDYSGLLDFAPDLPELFILGGLGYYFGEYDDNNDSEDVSGMGVRLGTGVAQEIAEDLDFRASLGYRLLDADRDLSGFEVSGGISYSF